MDEKKLNNQPQEEEEKKKKNKFVAWWLGLGKWAKVGICAGTAAVLATAITLPIVLTRNKAVEVVLVKNSEGDSYAANKMDYKKDVSYTFKAHVAKNSGRQMQVFYITCDGAEEPTYAKFASAEFTANGEKQNWEIKDGTQITGENMIKLDKDYDVVFKVKLAENFTNGQATLVVNRGE